MPSLNIDIKARLAEFQDSINRVERDTSRMVSGISSAFASLRGFVGLLGGAAALGGVATAIRNTAAELDALGKAAQGAGVTVEVLSGLRYAGEQAGLGIDKVDEALAELSVKLQEAGEGGNEAARAFAELRIDPRSFATADQALLALADAFAALPDGIQKTSISARIFGDELGLRVVPLLNEGADGITRMVTEAGTLGRVINTDLTVDAANFNAELTRLNSELDTLTRNVAGPAISTIADILKAFRDARQDGLGVAASAAEASLLPFELPAAIEAAEEEVARLQRLFASVREEISEGSFREGALTQTLKRTQAEITETEARLDRLYRRLSEANSRGSVDPFSPPAEREVRAPAETGTGDGRKLSDGERLIQQLQSRLDGMRDLTAVEQLNLDIARERVQLTATEATAARALAARIDAQREQNAALEAEIEMRRVIEAALERAAAEDQARADALARDAERFNDLSDPLREVNRELARVQEALDAGLITEGVAADNIERILGLGGAMREVREATVDLQRETEAYGYSVEAAIDQAIFSADKLSDVLKDLAIQIARIFVNEQIAKPIAGALGNFFAGSGQQQQSRLQPNGAADAFTSIFLRNTEPAGPSVQNTYNIAPGTSMSQVESAVASGVRMGQRQMVDSNARGGVFA